MYFQRLEKSKNYVPVLISLFVLTLSTGCADENNALSELKIDNVFIQNEDGSIQNHLQFNAETRKLISETNKSFARKVKIMGDLYKKEPNNDGGHNYYCWADDEDICYEK